MALDPVPWFVGGGAEHSPDVARMLANAATSGAAGVLGNLDFRVTPLDVPGTKVRMAAGAAVIPNGYLAAPDFGKQSYIARADNETELDVAATGSGSGRSDLVIVRMDDPQFGGQTPADVVNGPYVRFDIISNVSAGTKTLPSNLGYPAVLLARIDLPASTGTVEQEHIIDLRKVANPRRTRDLYNTQPTVTSNMGSSTADWSTQGNRNIAIPSWATQVKIIGHVAGIVNRTAPAIGSISASLGTLTTQATVIDMDTDTRGVALVADTLTIPTAMRNTSAVLKLRAARTNGTGTIQTDSYSTILWDVEFLEVASSD